MSGSENIVYTIAGIALTGSCALFILSSRVTLRSPAGIIAVQDTPPPAVRGPRLALGVAALGLLALVAWLVRRGMDAGRWPLGSPFEFTVAFAACVVLVYLALHRAAETPVPGAIITLLALALVVHGFFVQPEAARTIQPLPPAMRGIWFSLHTLLTALAFGALAVAGAVAAGSLIMSDLAAVALVDWAMDAGYVALGLGMIAGAIWGEQAWAEYWSGSIKETWTLITWLMCTSYDHVRRRRGWRGRRSMLVAALTLVAVLVTFFFTPTLVQWTRLQRLRIY